MASIPGDVQRFVEQCVVLTGFSEFDLHATGMGGLYLDTARQQVGHTRFEQFLTGLAQKKGNTLKPDHLAPTDREIARAVTYLWYTGAWPRMAETVHTELWGSATAAEQPKKPTHTGHRGEAAAEPPGKPANTEFVVSPSSYVEGLVWHTFNGHPVGAKPPGFGTWSVPPAEQPNREQVKQECGLAEKPKDGKTGEAPREKAPASGPESTTEPEPATSARLRRPGPLYARHVPPSAVPEAREPHQEVDPA